ncbi:MAG: DUF3124 domain-containing protein [Desulfobulbaceae bacterium]|nr:DUF3124 domain-containing protein [Desulfobulbaceae bacterium]HIJ91636.1 DUF3124 domain-containing protein [Deltaproteobacteria bacterium]
MKKSRCLSFLTLIALVLLVPMIGHTEGGMELSQGQTIYVPAYSHIYVGNREKPFLLTVTLSIRNTDTKHPVTITTADYYDTKGKLIRKYLEQPVSLGPLESVRYIVPQKDKSGGSGANFVVEWKSGKTVNPVLVETIMIGAESQQGISFTSRGQTISTTN